MLLQGYRKAHRVEVVECALFATPNPLKSHESQKELSPLVQHLCRNAKVVQVFEAFEGDSRRKSPGRQITYRG